MDDYIRRVSYQERLCNGLVLGFTEPILPVAVNLSPEYSDFSAIDWFSYYMWDAYMRTIMQALVNFLESKGILLTRLQLEKNLKSYQFNYDPERMSAYGPLNPMQWQSCLLNLHIDAIIDGFVNMAKTMNVYIGHEEVKLFLLRSAFQPAKFADQDDKFVCTHFARGVKGKKPRPCKDTAKTTYSKCVKHVKDVPETSASLCLIYRDCSFIPGPFSNTLVEKRMRGIYYLENNDFTKLTLLGKMVNGYIYTVESVFTADDISYAQYFNAAVPPESERSKLMNKIILDATAAGRPYMKPPSLEEKEQVFTDARIKTSDEIVQIQLSFPMEKRGQFLTNYILLFCKSNSIAMPESNDFKLHSSINNIYENFVRMSFHEKMRTLLSAYLHFYPQVITPEKQQEILTRYT